MVELLTERWRAPVVVARGEVIGFESLAGLVAIGDEGTPAGLLSYRVDSDSLEVVTLDAFERGRGVGTALLEHAVGVARDGNLRRVWLVTTNDNLDAVSFYLRRGLRLAAVYQNAVSWSREVQPSIPETGAYGIRLEDELELELLLDAEGPPQSFGV